MTSDAAVPPSTGDGGPEDVAVSALDATGIPNEIARALVGPRADYYLDRWTSTEKGRRYLGMNWAAFFGGVFWMAYRRMYVTLALTFASLFIWSVAERAILFHHLAPAEQSMISMVGTVLFWALCASLGSYWYLLEVQRRYEGLRRADRLTEAYIARAGGVSWAPVALLVVFFLALAEFVLLNGK
jgi:hypothetical protein